MPIQWPSPSFGGGTLPDRVPQNAKIAEEQPITATTQFDLGPPQKRLVGTGIIQALNFSLTLKTDAIVNALMTFHDTTCSNGILKFQWEMPNAHGTLRYMQFVERPIITWVEADIWTASVSLRVFP